MPNNPNEPGNPNDRRAELIAAAATDSLDAAEVAELDSLRLADPTIDVEIDELAATLSGLDALGSWDSTAPDAALRDRVLAIDNAPVLRLQPPAPPATPSRRRWLLALAAAACLVVGAGAATAVGALSSLERTGAPGTLGATEKVDFTGEPTGVAVDGSLVAHTWGTEALLEIDGLTVGDSYAVILVDSEGERTSSGTFLGSAVTIDCRMNGAVMRADVASVEIEDATGDVIATATLPAVT